MTHDTSGPTSQRALAYFDHESSCWRTLPLTSGGGSILSSRTLPSSGMTRRGRLYALPTSGPLIDGRASSLSPLLKTPTAQLGVNGGSQHPDKRKAGGHGPTLADEIEHLLPTPVVADSDRQSLTYARGNPTLLGALLPKPKASDGTKGGPNMRDSKGQPMLPMVACSVPALLPTPTARDHKGPGPLDRRPTGDDDLSTRLARLLPTPCVADAEGTRATRGGERSNELLLTGIARVVSNGGGSSPPPSIVGSTSSAVPFPSPPPSEPVGPRCSMPAWLSG